MRGSALRRLTEAGVSLWLDDISRAGLTGGSLAELVRDRRISGVTSDPAVLARALTAGTDYAEQLSVLAAGGATPEEAAWELMTHDLRHACDLLLPVYERTGGADGLVSAEVDPRLAHDSAATLAQARELSREIGRPNLLVKIPATDAGEKAVADCLAEGIGVNATLIFSAERCRRIAAAHVDGVARAAAAGHRVAGINSVASFSVGRVDTAVDALLDLDGSAEAKALRGTVALAAARLAHEQHTTVYEDPRWPALERSGARRQRLLWASTAVKNPDYPDTHYVDGLIVPNTVSTMPEETLRAVADHGLTRTAAWDESARAHARHVFECMSWFNISLRDITSQLEEEGLKQLTASWHRLLDTVAPTLDGAPR
ncbi:transaldolase [Streptomyces inusitatus]|uniref:Transaldolase n=1 Tax=Streptomyces inusitatus TaxID=68221 RepID=A0A918QPN0_9ACTN|nr:transaldolase [Streptomyces inusitatus]GGZ65185.1 transaldolase [Streptomyces inusitatus]